jgi:hypothetical protein
LTVTQPPPQPSKRRTFYACARFISLVGGAPGRGNAIEMLAAFLTTNIIAR